MFQVKAEKPEESRHQRNIKIFDETLYCTNSVQVPHLLVVSASRRGMEPNGTPIFQ
jgi:hypothetical protein